MTWDRIITYFNLNLNYHINNIVNFYNIKKTIKFQNKYIEEMNVFNNLFESDLIRSTVINIFKNYENIPNNYDTLVFIKSKYGKSILPTLLGQENFDDLIKSITDGEEKEKSMYSSFDEFYGANL